MKKLVLVLALGVSICSKAQYSPNMMKSYDTSIRTEYKAKEVLKVKDFKGVTIKEDYTLLSAKSDIEKIKEGLNSYYNQSVRGQERILIGVCLNVLSSLVVYNLMPNDDTNASRNLSVGLAVTGLSYSVAGGVDFFRAYRHLKK